MEQTNGDAGERKDTVNGTPKNEELQITLYQDLQQLAVAKMSAERPQTLQATALVHEAWLKLGSQRFAYFFRAAAEAMRRILVERARRRSRLKRGSNLERADYEKSQISSPLKDEKLLHDALDQLEKQDPTKAQIVTLRFLAGLENGEVGALLGVSEEKVRRQWHVANVQLYQLLKHS